MPDEKSNRSSEEGGSGKIDRDEQALSQIVAERGIATTADFADFMAALMADVINGKISPKVANAACIAGDRLLRIAKLHLDQLGTDDAAVLRLSGPKKMKGLTTSKQIVG